MKKFENILIASDIDGTFVWDGVHIPDRNLERLRDFRENGGHFTFSTGRNHKDLYQLFPNLREIVNMPCILCNGSYLFDAENDAILNPHYLDSAALDLFREVDCQFPHAGFRVSFPGGFLVPKHNTTILKEFARHGIEKAATIRDFSEFDGQNWFKGVFVSDKDTLSQIEQIIKTRYSGLFSLTRSSEKMLEIQPLGVSKSTQFPYLRSQYPNASVYCIGDFDNDIEMLRAANIAACPQNASEQVKSICHMHLCHCQNGAIADLIDHIEASLSSF